MAVETTAFSPPTLGAAVNGVGAGICRPQGRWGLFLWLFRRGTPTPPWVGHKARPAGHLGAHNFLSDTEKLCHIPNDVAEVVVHLKVGAHPGGQLGSGVSTGEPGGRVAFSLGPLLFDPLHCQEESPRTELQGAHTGQKGQGPQRASSGQGEPCLPVIAQEDSPIVVAVPDDPPNGLVHSPGRLQPVPLLPREELQG